MTTPAPAPMTADKEMAAWLHRTCKAKKVNKTYGCDNFHCVYCRAARHIGIDAEHIDALTARVATLESELAAARKVEDGEVAAYVQKLRDFDVGDTETWIADNWPLEAADLLTRLSAALKEAEERARDFERRANHQFDAVQKLGHDFLEMQARAQAAEAKLEQADEKICQAYQIVGSLAHETNTFDVPAVQRALDYLSGDAFDANFLPWSIRALQTKDTTE